MHLAVVWIPFIGNEDVKSDNYWLVYWGFKCFLMIHYFIENESCLKLLVFVNHHHLRRNHHLGRLCKNKKYGNDYNIIRE